MVVSAAAHVGMVRTAPGQFRLQGLLVEPVLEDRIDTAIGAGSKVQRPAAGGFQAVLAGGLAQTNDPQTRPIALLGMGFALQDLAHQLGTGRAGLLRPLHDAPGRPFQVFLVGLGAMLVERREQSRLGAAGVRGDALAVVEHLDGRGGQTHVQRLMDQLVGHAVVMLVHHDVVVDVHAGLRPGGQLKRRRGQGQQLWLFIGFKPTVARALQLLKRLSVELGQQRPDRGVELGDTEEGVIPQRRQDLPFGDEHVSLDLGFVAGAPGTGGNDDRAVVLAHLQVSAVEQWFVAAGTEHAGLGVVGNRDASHAGKERVSLAMGRDPGGQLLIGKSLRESLVAGAQDGDEHRGGADDALGSLKGHSLSGPIDEHLLPGRVMVPHDRIKRLGPAMVIFAILGVAVAVGKALPVFLQSRRRVTERRPNSLCTSGQSGNGRGGSGGGEASGWAWGGWSKRCWIC